MITNKETQILKLSPTKKDYYQIWEELLETAKKISDRWDPTATNESDPGIVLLKVLTAVADKLNYNIDKNILEAYMPTAAQEDSVRKLCEMMGYNIKYYQSAETDVTVTYIGETELTETLNFPEFMVFSNLEKDLSFVSTTRGVITNDTKSTTIHCLQGTLEQCENDNNNIITVTLLDDDNRYFFPETQVAENGIFIYNCDANRNKTGVIWDKVDNLNIQPLETNCYKFGFDSKLKLPYVQFPEDISELIKNGLLIYYVRTQGINGNSAINTIVSFESPNSTDTNDIWAELAVDTDFQVYNSSIASGGKNIETIRQAYKNYKKTIGTFDTLVTCRDYINKIYSLINDLTNVPIVSNVIVSDIRDDINRSINICTFNDYGITYSDQTLTKTISDKTEALINNFDLVLYPFKTVYGLNSKDEFKNSFKYTNENNELIKSELNNNKLISHVWRSPNDDEIVCIKNYLKLNAKITTTAKVNAVEQSLILAAIKASLFNQFNMRELDFGEEIPFDDILECIEGADVRIKNVSLDEPTLYTKFLTADGNEYGIASNTSDTSDTNKKAKSLYNKLALRNILAGRIALFDYYTDFKSSFTEKAYSGKNAEDQYLDQIYPAVGNKIDKIESECKITLSSSDEIAPIKLEQNEVVQLRAPNFKTTITYPAYVNYYFDYNSSNLTATTGEAAEFKDLATLLSTQAETILNGITEGFKQENSITETLFNTSSPLFTKNENTYERATLFSSSAVYYSFTVTASNFAQLYNNILTATDFNGYSNNYSLFKRYTTNMTLLKGKFVDDKNHKFTPIYSIQSGAGLANYYVCTKAGQDAVIAGLKPNTVFKLGANKLYINYTPSTTDTTETTTPAPITKTLTGDVLILPNFNLLTSNGNTATKPKKLTAAEMPASSGITEMYTLGPNEQIEIVEPIKVNLHTNIDNSQNCFIYWELHNSNNELTLDDNNSYTLQEGEYFYYTNDSKTNMAYYGNGTRIVFIGGLTVPTIDHTSTAEDILNGGLASVHWVKISMSSGQDIELQEYQYINITADDYIKGIEAKDIGTKDPITNIITETDAICLDNTWKKCTSINYGFASDDDPDSVIHTLPELNAGKDYNWEIRSKLDLNFGSGTTQKLLTNDTITESLKVYYTNDTDPISINSSTIDNVVSIKSNYEIQSSAGIAYINNIFAEDTNNDFKLKLVKESEITPTLEDNSSAEILSLNNFGDHWTKFATTASKTEIPLNILLPDDSNYFGLIMIYCGQIGTNNTTIQHKDFSGVSQSALSNLNNINNNTDNLTLKPGVNVIKITSSGVLTITSNNSSDTIVFSDLDIVKAPPTNKKGINPRLNYNNDVDNNKNIFTDISALIDSNNNFYYNLPVEKNYAIDLNEAITDSDTECLNNPKVWYSANNINNKFVISEIDADYLDTGITIARTSKL